MVYFPKQSTRMHFTVQFSNGSSFSPSEYVLDYSPPSDETAKYAQWIYRFDGLMHTIGMIRAVRTQVLRQEGQVTHYHSDEVFTGWGRGLLNYEAIAQGFEAQGLALKERCEADGTF